MARAFARLIISLAFLCATLDAIAADAPVIGSVIDAGSGAVLWQRSNGSALPDLKPGQAIILRGHGFGRGPVTAARPGLEPPRRH